MLFFVTVLTVHTPTLHVFALDTDVTCDKWY